MRLHLEYGFKNHNENLLQTKHGQANAQKLMIDWTHDSKFANESYRRISGGDLAKSSSSRAELIKKETPGMLQNETLQNQHQDMLNRMMPADSRIMSQQQEGRGAPPPSEADLKRLLADAIANRPVADVE
jgi:hypothetical protein